MTVGRNPKLTAAERSPASGAVSDLETAAKAALVDGSATSEKGSAERLQGAKDKIEADTARYEALAREHGADLSEEGFNEALRKVSKSPRK